MRKFIVLMMIAATFLAASVTFAATSKKWTFIIYLNGNNSLDYYGGANIRDMEKIGSNDDVNIVVQWASQAKRKAVRLLVQKSNDSSTVTSPILEDLGLVDMGNYHTLEAFIKWSVEHYPAEHYFINVWNHGGGWRHHFGVTRDISWDDISGNVITTEQLGEAMQYAHQVIGHKVDIYGSDACLMGMAEVANEMVDHVSYFVGSQEVEPGPGWPYDAVLRHWEAESNRTPEQIANILAEEYVASYQNGNWTTDVTFSGYDLTKLAAFDSTIEQLGRNLRELSPNARKQLIEVIGHIQTFSYRDYGDVIDFMDKLSSANIRGVDSNLIQQVKQAAQALIIANVTTPRFENAHGLSMWIPLNPILYKRKAERYANLAFNQHTQWNDTLDFIQRGIEIDDNLPTDLK